MKSKVFYLNSIPIRAETVKRLDPHRQVYRLELETCQELHGLPTVVIIKKRNEDRPDESQQEIEVYEKFKSLQGSVIPTFLGQGTFDDSPMIILSEVVGRTLSELAYSEVHISVDVVELRRQLEIAMNCIHSLGAEYLDQQLGNFILCDTGKIMIVDFEQIDFPPDLEEFKQSVNFGGVGSLLYLFNDARKRMKTRTLWGGSYVWRAVPLDDSE